MSILTSITNNELVDAISFFPELRASKEIQDRLTSTLNKEIKNKSSAIWNKKGKNNERDKTEVLSLLINKYFKLTAYDKLNKLNLLDWATQFIIRKKLINKLSYPGQHTFDLSNHECQTQTTIFELIYSPIIDHRKYPIMFLDHLSSVNDLSIIDLHTIADKYISDGTFKLIEDTNGLLGDEYEISNEIFDVFVSPVNDALVHGNEPRITATIDLNINDAQLKEDFAEYLTKKRSELNIESLTPKKFKSGKIKSLIDNRVLQYLDLKILDLYINGKETLEQHQLASYIYPDTDDQNTDKDATEKIRKSTIRYANEMMEENVINLMLIESKKLYPGNLHTGKK